MSDNITKAISEILEMLDFINAHGGFTEYNDYSDLHDAVSLLPCNDWISVEDALPETDDAVLCWYEYYHWSKEKILPEYGIGFCINGIWCGEVSNGRNAKVLAWMPLPEPPVVEVDDD